MYISIIIQICIIILNILLVLRIKHAYITNKNLREHFAAAGKIVRSQNNIL